jgi:hypothetical protein
LDAFCDNIKKRNFSAEFGFNLGSGQLEEVQVEERQKTKKIFQDSFRLDYLQFTGEMTTSVRCLFYYFYSTILASSR